MKVNVVFNDEMTDLDIIDIPEQMIPDLESLQKKFYKWLFDKNNNHSYWVHINNEKKYCAYRSEAFVDWLNNIYFNDSKKKAIVLSQNEKQINMDYPKLVF